jgi:hypothetical protein
MTMEWESEDLGESFVQSLNEGRDIQALLTGKGYQEFCAWYESATADELRFEWQD